LPSSRRRRASDSGSGRPWASSAAGGGGDDSLLDDVVMPYGEMRDNLVNDPAQTALRIVTEAQPLCAAGEEPLAGANDLIPSCRPAADGLESFYAGLWARWQEEPRRYGSSCGRMTCAVTATNITLGELIRRDAAPIYELARPALRLELGPAGRWLGPVACDSDHRRRGNCDAGHHRRAGGAQRSRSAALGGWPALGGRSDYLVLGADHW